MSDLMIEKLSEVSLGTALVIVIFISVLIQFITPLFKKLKDAIIRKYKKEQKDKNLETIVHETEVKIKQYAENRIHDREQSFKIQEELVSAIEKLNQRLDDMQELQEKRYNESLERENKRVRAELKDRISQVYRYHHAKGSWNSMDKESLEDLIAEYESAGGMNSFVHDVVIPDMYKWELEDCNYIPSKSKVGN